MPTLPSVIGWTLCGLVILIEFAIVWLIFKGRIDLSRLISEPNGDASMSRFQLLIFTFVVALSLFYIVVASVSKTTELPNVPGGILALLGISSSSYLISKGIQFSSAEGVEDRPPMVTVSPASVSLAAGARQQFTAEVIRATNTEVLWAIHPEIGTIEAKTGRYTAPADIPPGNPLVTVKATSVADASAFGTAAITLG